MLQRYVIVHEYLRIWTFGMWKTSYSYVAKSRMWILCLPPCPGWMLSLHDYSRMISRYQMFQVRLDFVLKLTPGLKDVDIIERTTFETAVVKTQRNRTTPSLMAKRNYWGVSSYRLTRRLKANQRTYNWLKLQRRNWDKPNLHLPNAWTVASCFRRQRNAKDYSLLHGGRQRHYTIPRTPPNTEDPMFLTWIGSPSGN